MGLGTFFENRKILSRAEDEITLDADFLWLSIIASVLATMAILMDDQYILIGAMLVAPFLDPIISFVGFAILGKLRDAVLAFVTLMFVYAISIMSAMITYLLAELVGFVPEVVVYEPATGGEYFVVAILLGIIGSLMWIWPKTSNTLAGLSIGISLVPPLANIGRALALWDVQALNVSAQAFLISLGGVLIGSFLVLYFRPKD